MGVNREHREPSQENGAAATEDADVREVVAATTEPAEPRWPDESAEAAIMTEVRARDTQPESADTGAAPLSTPAADQKKLPSLEPLVARLPAATRTALDELFRAKFTLVRRVPESALNP